MIEQEECAVSQIDHVDSDTPIQSFLAMVIEQSHAHELFVTTCAVSSVPAAFMSCFTAVVIATRMLDGAAIRYAMSDGIGFLNGFNFALYSAIPFWAAQFQGRLAQKLALIAMILLFFFRTVVSTELPALAAEIILCAIYCLLGIKIVAIGTWLHKSMPKYLHKCQSATAVSPLMWLCQHPWITMCTLATSFLMGNLSLFVLPVIGLLLCVSWPSFIMARLSNSKSLAAAAGVAVIMQVPLMAGLLVGGTMALIGAALCAIPGGLTILAALFPSNSFYSLQEHAALLMFAMAFVVAIFAMAGGYFGAWLNGARPCMEQDESNNERAIEAAPFRDAV
jgi:hypothetical protein